jgi:hypothetical protein
MYPECQFEYKVVLNSELNLSSDSRIPNWIGSPPILNWVGSSTCCARHLGSSSLMSRASSLSYP